MCNIAKKCDTCPFNDGYNEEATRAQNYGCLPTKFDILDAKDQRGEDWMCHSDETKICGGLAAERKVGDGKPILYSKWYQGDYLPPAERAKLSPKLVPLSP